MGFYKTRWQTKVFILIAPDFDEQSVIDCLCQMRQEGLSVSLVALSPGLLSGLHGLTIRPDLSLTQLEQLNLSDMRHILVIPGGHACITTLLTDPRVHQLVESTLNLEGLVAAMAPAQQLLANTGILFPLAAPNFFGQGGMETAEFIEQVIKRISV